MAPEPNVCAFDVAGKVWVGGFYGFYRTLNPLMVILREHPFAQLGWWLTAESFVMRNDGFDWPRAEALMASIDIAKGAAAVDDIVPSG